MDDEYHKHNLMFNSGTTKCSTVGYNSSMDDEPIKFDKW